MYAGMYVCEYVCMYLWMYVGMYVCMYVCTHDQSIIHESYVERPALNEVINNHSLLQRSINQ